MNYKRKKPKSARAGCLLCKPWKVMGNSRGALRVQELRNLERVSSEISVFKNTDYQN